MKQLQKFGAGAVLVLMLGLPAFAGEVLTPPCAAGEVLTPPCAVAPGDIDTPGFTSTAPASLATPRVASGGASFAELAADILLNFLPLY
jgi:hypothetical protein